MATPEASDDAPAGANRGPQYAGGAPATQRSPACLRSGKVLFWKSSMPSS
jgi:hypothetical protein